MGKSTQQLSFHTTVCSDGLLSAVTPEWASSPRNDLLNTFHRLDALSVAQLTVSKHRRVVEAVNPITVRRPALKCSLLWTRMMIGASEVGLTV